MNTLIELGPNLRASLEAIAPGESVPEQLCILLAQRNALLKALQNTLAYMESDSDDEQERKDYEQARNAIAIAQNL